MAFCPKCKSMIGMTDIICNKCGYDFPQTDFKDSKHGWEYSIFSDIALIIGSFFSLIYAMFTMVISILNLLSGIILTSMFGIVQAVVFFSLAVALLRIKNLKNS